MRRALHPASNLCSIELARSRSLKISLSSADMCSTHLPCAAAAPLTRSILDTAAIDAAVGTSAFQELSAGAERKYIMVSGKGGVGKTSLAASLAVRFAQEGHATLVVSTDPAHSLGDSLAQVIASCADDRVAAVYCVLALAAAAKHVAQPAICTPIVTTAGNARSHKHRVTRTPRCQLSL
jgi:predicted ATP-dependent serine protease